MDVTDVIVYILNKNNNISGTGFVIAKDNIIITCSHVIQDQISQQRGEDKPEKVTVVFYKTGAKYNAIVEPQWWRDWNQGDIAILRLESTLPSNIPEIQFASYTNINEYTVKSLGFPNIDNITGIYGEGNVKGVISNKNNNLLQLSSNDFTVGFSGAPIWIKSNKLVIGMITSIKIPDRYGRLGDVAFATPIESLWKICPSIRATTNIKNPFKHLNGILERPEPMFDREEEVQEAFDILNSGASVALIGDRSVGKSSVLRSIYRQVGYRILDNRKPIFIDLQVIQDDNDFYNALCEQIGVNTVKGYALKKALQNHRILLILDGMENLAMKGFTHYMRSFLRSMASGLEAPIRLVVSASTPLDRLFPTGNVVSPFENIFIEVKIDNWNEDTIRNFITDRLSITHIVFSEDQIRKVIQQSNGNPWQIINICNRIFNSYL